MTIHEATRLAKVLASDRSSWTYTALQGWDYPLPLEAGILADLFDAYALGHFRRPKPYPRPWHQRKREHLGKTELTQDEIFAALRMAGHGLPHPN